MEVAGLVFLAAAVGWWVMSMQARETALKAGKRASMAAGVQFLDDTLELRRVRLLRNDLGQLAVLREYRFEFSDTGDNRRAGLVTVMGGRTRSVELETDSGVILEA
jgi:hypothetical protein